MSTIVVVDDDREMGRLLSTLLELEGYKVVVVSQYNDILPTLREVQPDILLMDVRIRNQETIPLLQQLRQDEGLCTLPVVMTSGMDLQRRCKEAGADLFILKPFLPDDLVRQIGALLDQSSHTR